MELAQLAYNAFHHVHDEIGGAIKAKGEKLKMQYTIGLRNDGSHIMSEREYTEEEFKQHHIALADHALPLQGIYSLVQIMEAMLSEIIKNICMYYPQKVGLGKTITLENVLKCGSMESIKELVIQNVLDELMYKSPREFAEYAKDIIDFNLLEMPQYHQYIELKATRDIYIHNQGLVNATYLRKTGANSRAKVGETLFIGNPYYIQKYESCLQIFEELEVKFHAKWHSPAHQTLLDNRAKEHAEEATSQSGTNGQVMGDSVEPAASPG